MTASSPLRQHINDALKTAMLGKDQATVDACRLINAKIKDADIAARPKADAIDDGALLSLLQGMVKSRRESIELYQKGGRAELAAKEQAEIDVINRFLPKQLSEAETKEIIKKAIAETGAASVKDMGKVMGVLKTQYAGQVDFSQAGNWVKDALNAA
ncbi:MAG: GatB/YqeY domain-containing protein [Bdellovibrionales bacterium]